MSSALISAYLAVVRLRQEMCNQHLYLTHQKGSFVRSAISGLPGCVMFSICTADLTTARVIENTTFFNIPAFVAVRVRLLPHPKQGQRVFASQPQRLWHFPLSLRRMGSVKKRSKGRLREIEFISCCPSLMEQIPIAPEVLLY